VNSGSKTRELVIPPSHSKPFNYEEGKFLFSTPVSTGSANCSARQTNSKTAIGCEMKLSQTCLAKLKLANECDNFSEKQLCSRGE